MLRLALILLVILVFVLLALLFYARARSHQSIRRLNQKVRDLELSNSRLERFAYMAAHDLRSPLATVQGYLDILAEDHLSREDYQEYLNTARGTVSRALTLVNGLLSYARLRAWEPAISCVDSNKVLQYALTDLSAKIQERNAKIQIGRLSSIYADERMLHELTCNLVENAIKYSRPNVRPEVKIFCEERVTPSAVYDELVIRDNGKGFAEDRKDQIFEAFSRLDSGEEVPGLGLGLAICSQIVKSHQGYIDVSSAVGEGSTFRVGFPRRDYPMSNA